MNNNTTLRRKFLLAASLAVLPWLGTAPAIAQEFPVRPITFVVPFGPGSATDQLARAIGQGVGIELGN